MGMPGFRAFEGDVVYSTMRIRKGAAGRFTRLLRGLALCRGCTYRKFQNMPVAAGSTRSLGPPHGISRTEFPAEVAPGPHAARRARGARSGAVVLLETYV